MNRIRNTCLCALTGLAVFCTAACTRGPAQAFEPTEDSLYITGSGQVTSAAIETYEKDYYTEEGLKAFDEENLAAFNQDAGHLGWGRREGPSGLKCVYTGRRDCLPAHRLLFSGGLYGIYGRVSG